MALKLAKAAERHRRCAYHLAHKREEAEACYLVGLAAECAIKHHLQQIGFPLIRKSRSRRRSVEPTADPLFLHFPDLATELLAQGQGILSGRILEKIGDSSLLQGWNVKMRYQDQPSSPRLVSQYNRWVKQTDALFQEVGL